MFGAIKRMLGMDPGLEEVLGTPIYAMSGVRSDLADYCIPRLSQDQYEFFGKSESGRETVIVHRGDEAAYGGLFDRHCRKAACGFPSVAHQNTAYAN